MTIDERAPRQPNRPARTFGPRPRAVRVLLALILAIGLIGGVGPSPARPSAALAASTHAKVVIVVGPTEGVTASYVRDANAIAKQISGYGATVIKVYSPHATLAALQAAAKGANLLIYLGHGTGWPNPYPRPTGRDPNKDDGFGLNTDSTNTAHKYFGEAYIAKLALTPGAIMIFNHACYTAGSSEPGKTPPKYSVAFQRADNYASGFLKAGAKAVLATASTPSTFIAALFRGRGTVRQAFWAMPSTFATYQHLKASVRTPGATVLQAPKPATKYYDAITGNLGYTVTAWRATWGK